MAHYKISYYPHIIPRDWISDVEVLNLGGKQFEEECNCSIGKTHQEILYIIHGPNKYNCWNKCLCLFNNSVEQTVAWSDWIHVVLNHYKLCNCCKISDKHREELYLTK